MYMYGTGYVFLANNNLPPFQILTKFNMKFATMFM